MNRSALIAFLAATAAAAASFAAQAGPSAYTDNARVLAAEPQYENVNVPRQECRNEWVPESRRGRGQGYGSSEARDYGGVVVGGLAGALLGNQVGRGHGREAATAVGAVVGALAGDAIARGNAWEARGDRWDGRAEPAGREVTTCHTVNEVRSRITGYRVDYEYRGQRFSTLMRDQPGAYLPVRVSVEPVGR